MNILNDIWEAVHEDYHHVIENIPNTEPYTLTISYVPTKDMILVCINTENSRLRDYVRIESASSCFLQEDLDTLDTVNYDALGIYCDNLRMH